MEGGEGGKGLRKMLGPVKDSSDGFVTGLLLIQDGESMHLHHKHAAGQTDITLVIAA